jgi:glycosyltransferase involved in cell wall biosynthesis
VTVETSVVIPTLDDAATLVATVERLNRELAATSAAAEVLIVDAGSTDGTLALAGEVADRYPLLHMRVLVQDRLNAGFGDLLRLGVAYAQGRYCVVVMPDARDPLELIPKMLAELRGGAHLVLCSRYESAGLAASNVPWRFRIYQAVYRRAVRTVLGVDVPDSTYGFRAFHRTFVLALGLSGHRMSVCSEITFKVLLAGGRTERLPGAPTGPMLSQQKFRLGNELGGYSFMLGRAGLHRAGLRWV